MKKIFLILLILVMVFMSCNSDKEGKTTTTNEIKNLKPEELGNRIADVYIDCIKRLSTILESRPDVKKVKSDVDKLKEETITKMVELGKALEKLEPLDKGSANSSLTNKMWTVAKLPEYISYQEAVQYYNGVDSDFSWELSQFNIITQYSQFDLLRIQYPEEAKRLGIE